MLAHTHITVLIREHERKTHLHHDEQGMEIPYDNGRILFKRDPISRGYAAESGNALTIQAACLFVNRIMASGALSPKKPQYGDPDYYSFKPGESL